MEKLKALYDVIDNYKHRIKVYQEFVRECMTTILMLERRNGQLLKEIEELKKPKKNVA